MDFLNELTSALGADAVLTGDDVTARVSGWGTTQPCAALAVVRPASVGQVSKVLELCHREGRAVIPEGGRTGLVGGTLAEPSEIVLSLERLREIEEVDTSSRTMTVQAGVTLEAVQERAEREGLLFALDLGARGTCTIGGNVATNAGGNHVIRYGMTRAQVLGLEAVLADGTVVSRLTKTLKDNAGYDLKHLFIGSEGTLGVVTRVVLRLHAKPSSAATALLAVASFDQVVSLLGLAQSTLGAELTAFEVMWREFYELVTTPPALGTPPLDGHHPLFVLTEALGSEPESDGERFESFVEKALEEGLIEDAVLATSASERRALWSLRDDVEQMSRLGPIYTFDVSLPIASMEQYVADVRAGLSKRWKDASCVVFGHLGDGNLHVIVGVGESGPEVRTTVEESVYGPLPESTGSISAEHGIGLEKRRWLENTRSPAELRVMHALKNALDPKGILNPGKVIRDDAAVPRG